MIKKRKKRSNDNYNICSCGYPYCDPMCFIIGSIAGPKIHKRLSDGKCMGCGKKDCNCKS